MKSYFAPNQISLVGKAWEVKHYLRTMMTQSNQSDLPILEVLRKITTQSIKKKKQ